MNAGGTANINLTGNTLAQTINGNAGNNILDGGADVAIDTLVGGAGNDTYKLGTSTVDVVTEGAGGGTDTIVAAKSINLASYANVENLTLTSALAADANGTGSSVDNVIIGSTAVNILDGKGGNDTLTGGGSNDVFMFSTALNASTNVDLITDFAHTTATAHDTIRLDNTIFTALTTAGAMASTEFVSSASGVATTTAQHITYSTTTGWLSYDADGSGAGAAVHFATLGATTHPTTLIASDIVVV